MSHHEFLKTGDVARLLGVSRQHVVDLCDRGDLSFVWVGSHRRIPADEVPRIVGVLTREQERSLWLHQASLSELLARPAEVLHQAGQNLDRWRVVHRSDGMTARYFDEWARIIESGLDAVVETFTSRTPAASELRQNSPFAGVLPAGTRVQVLRSFHEHWSHEHNAA